MRQLRCRSVPFLACAVVGLAACGGSAAGLAPEAAASRVVCPRYAHPPQGNSVRAAIDWVIVDGTILHRLSDPWVPADIAAGPVILETRCRRGYVDDPDPLVDGHSSSLPRGTEIHHPTNGASDTVVVPIDGEMWVYQLRP